MKYIISISFLFPLIIEYLVIINIYNGDKTPFNEVIEYSLMDIIAFLGLILSYFLKTKPGGAEPDIFEWIFTILSFIAHIQWYVHSPFEPWPTWWPATQTEGDVRHRTEYYDTHVMIFCIYLGLLLRRNQLKSKPILNQEPGNYIV